LEGQALVGFNHGIKEENMTSGCPDPEALATGVPYPVLEIAHQEGQTPLRLPVVVQNFSLEKVTLAVVNPWVIGDWQRYRDQDCLLRLPGSQGQKPISIHAKIAWSRFNADGQSPLSLGLHMAKPPGEALRRLSTQITHSSQDIKGLWERYDQVKDIPAKPNWARYAYIAGLALLLGGVVLQLDISPHFTRFGWVLWFLGTMGIAPKVLRPFWRRGDYQGQREIRGIGHAD
jgi:hypothetical protein